MNMAEFGLGCLTVLLIVGMVCNAWRDVAKERAKAERKA